MVIVANFINWFHIFWILLLIGGGIISIFYKSYLSYHIAIITTTIISQIMFLGCPLVLLQSIIEEKYLGVERPFKGSFLVMNLEKYLDLKVNPIFLFCLLLVMLVFSFYIFCWRKNG